jgi:hypothetical protein
VDQKFKASPGKVSATLQKAQVMCHLPGMCKALGSIPSPEKKKNLNTKL